MQFQFLNAATFVIDLAYDGSHELLGHFHSQRRHDLQQIRFCGHHGLASRDNSSFLESLRSGVFIMVAPSSNLHFHVRHLASSHDSCGDDLQDALLHVLKESGRELFGFNRINLYAGTARQRLDAHVHMCVLIFFETGSVQVLAFSFGRIADCFQKKQ